TTHRRRSHLYLRAGWLRPCLRPSGVREHAVDDKDKKREPEMADELTFRDEAAALYDQAFAHVTAYFMPFLLRAAGVAPGMRVLDIATGTGLPPKRPSPRSARPATSPPPTSRRPWLRSTPITAPLNAAVARLV